MKYVKNNKGLGVMKFIACLLMIAIVSGACKKDKGSDGPGKKITDVVPAEHLKTVKDNGMQIYEGATPPDIQGEFSISPLRFDYDNYSEPGTGLQPGHIMGDIKVEFEEQQANQDIQVNFAGTFLGGVEIKSPFITGSGNNFTVCFEVYMFGGPAALFTYPYAYLISGTAEGGVLKNIKIASVGLKGGTNEPGYTVAGNVTLYSESDGASERLD